LSHSLSLIGNDVIDLHHPSIREHIGVFHGRDDDWMIRHLTPGESIFLRSIPCLKTRGLTFWKIFALKEAASKAVSQAGIFVPHGSFTHFETELSQETVIHCSGLSLKIAKIEENYEWVHVVVTSESRVDRIFWQVNNREDEDPSQSVRDRLYLHLKEKGYSSLHCLEKNGIPYLSAPGLKPMPVSFSHSGRFIAFSWIDGHGNEESAA
jgi:phosphopantetheinyl transferase (holo-ACP synthase)